MNAHLTALIAQQHTADLARAAARHNRHATRAAWAWAPAVELRPARPQEHALVARLAALDDAPPLQGPALLAVVGGRAVAALALDDGRIVADPFVPSAHAVTLLRLRAAHLSPAPPRRRRRIRLPRVRLA